MDSAHLSSTAIAGTGLARRWQPAHHDSGSVPWNAVSLRTGSGGASARSIPLPARPASRSAPALVTEPPPEVYAVPDQFSQAVWLRSQPRLGIRVINPLIQLTVSDEDRDGIYVVTDSFSTVFGSGDTIDSAIADYVTILFLTFDELDRDESILGPGYQRELRALRGHLARAR